MRLRTATPAALHLQIWMIRYIDIISFNVFGGGGLVLISQSVVTLQLEQFLSVYSRGPIA